MQKQSVTESILAYFDKETKKDFKGWTIEGLQHMLKYRDLPYVVIRKAKAALERLNTKGVSCA